ncbi:FeoC-like transcriptional regulator [Motilibacter rhizosphaerae]|uniref:FeoC-like transcriptional regulator n=1 Tax=Motilibacter rhizosphaerae TaxID=598652 RepID=A0A4Q7NAT0_9ACTN|nr:FeoC-like transcriptional regulator [Motilibacter rhizosphaerae]RZS80019.1 FeoC-like transcriptional regulator [Motilibacter rhizosphaerae]
MSSPTALRQVLLEVRGAAGGGVRLDDVARRVGASVAEVSAMVDYWVRKGALVAEPLAGGCPDGGCGTCPSGEGDAPGCGSPGPAVGPVAISIARRP